jgi:hypothetical protein
MPKLIFAAAATWFSQDRPATRVPPRRTPR